MFTSPLNLTPSATVAIHSLAAEKKARGERIYNLSAGEPILSPHPLVKQAAERALADGKTLYPPVAGVPALRAAAADWINTTYGANFRVDETLVTSGGKFAIFAALQGYLRPGDEVIIIAPYWVSYPALVRLFNGVPVFVETSPDRGWQIDAAQIAAAITPRTRLIIINNGANPTGVVYTKDTVTKIVELAVQHDILLISDEVYSGLLYDAEYASAAAVPHGKKNSIIIQSCSKHFAMTGWRVGFMFGPTEIIKTSAFIQGQSTTGASSVSQWAALAALQNAPVIMGQVRAAMLKRRNVFCASFSKTFGAPLMAPAAGLYSFFPLAWLGVDNELSVDFCNRTINQGNIALTPGSAFGREGYVRASFGAAESELTASVAALKEFLNA